MWAGVALACACNPFAAVAGDGSDGGAGGADGPSGADGAIDARAPDAAAFDAATSFCSAQPALFCEDFDRADSLPPSWTPAGPKPAAVAKGDLSLPNALEVRGAKDEWGEAYVQAIALSPAAIRLTFEVALTDQAPRLWFTQLDWNYGASRRHTLKVKIDAVGGVVEESDGPTNAETPLGTSAVPAFAWTAGWHKIVLDVDWGTLSANLSVDGVSKVKPPLVGPFNGGALFVELGVLTFGDDATDATVRRLAFDNVVVETP